MCSSADPGTRSDSALLHQISITLSSPAGVLRTFSGASRSAVILIVLLDAGLRTGCSQDNIHEPKTLGK